MIPNEAKLEWWDLQDKYSDLRGWALVEDNRSKRRLGCCSYHKKTLLLSSWLWTWNGEKHPQLIDTLRHEAAHALVGPGAGHGPTWKQKAILLGANPKARIKLARVGLENRYALKAVCSLCKKVYLRHRRMRNAICPCSRGLPEHERKKFILEFESF